MSELLFGPTTSWFAIPGLVGTAFFLGRMALMMIGGGDTDAGGFDAFDAADALDGDVGFDDSGDAFEVLSLQAIAAFMMGFGWGGLAAYRGSGLPLPIALVVAVLVGVVMVWILARVLRFVMGLQSSGTLPLYHALEATGTVYAQVPAEESGTGEVRIVIGDRERYFFATTKGEALPRDTSIRVIAIDAEANRVEVVRA